MPFTHKDVQGYDVTEAQQVKPRADFCENSNSTLHLDDAIRFYLDAFSEQFSGKDGLTRKRQYLRRFRDHLADHGHSLRTADFSLEDG